MIPDSAECSSRLRGEATDVPAKPAGPRAAIRWTIAATVLFIVPIVLGAAFALRGALDRLAFIQVQAAAADRVFDLWTRYEALATERDRGGPVQERAVTETLERIGLNASRLFNQADLEHNDLADAMTLRLPRTIAMLRRIRDLVAEKPGGSRAAVERRLQIVEARAGARVLLDQLQYWDMSELLQLDPSLRAGLGPAETTAQAAARSSLSLLDAPKPRRPLKPVLTAALATLARLEERLVAADRAYLATRIGVLRRAVVFDVVPGLLGVLAAVALGISIARSFRREAEFREMRRESERLTQQGRFQAVFEGATAGIVIVDRRGMVAATNRAFNRMLGHPDDFFVGKGLSAYTFEADQRKTRERFSELADGAIDSYQFEKRYVRSDGSLIWADVSVSRLPIEDPAGWFALALIEDITDRKAIEAQLLYDATHDELTGLANRSLLASRLSDFLRAPAPVAAALVFIDLDHFKLINDSLGHATGDELLRAVAARLLECAGPDDTVARFGGDEFAVLFGSLAHVADLTRRVRTLNERIAEPFHIGGRTIYSTASIGVAPIGPRYGSAEEILRDADTAMYRAKTDGRARAALFDQAMHEGALRRLQLISDLRSAVHNDELVVAYQPIVRLSDGEIVAFEALVRWNHPRDGMLPPSAFIEVAEETGQIVSVGRSVFRQACEQLVRERATRPAAVMHVNLAVQEIMQPDLAEFVNATLLATGLPPEAIVVEITENAIIESSLASDASLRALRAIGVGICIDDFGVGYSSLRYLHQFPISGLKIDRSFVSGTAGSTELTSEPIVRMLLDLARTLGLEVVAEGIEYQGQCDELQALGAQYGQGFLFAEPVVPECV